MNLYKCIQTYTHIYALNHMYKNNYIFTFRYVTHCIFKVEVQNNSPKTQGHVQVYLYIQTRSLIILPSIP